MLSWERGRAALELQIEVGQRVVTVWNEETNTAPGASYTKRLNAAVASMSAAAPDSGLQS